MPSPTEPALTNRSPRRPPLVVFSRRQLSGAGEKRTGCPPPKSNRSGAGRSSASSDVPHPRRHPRHTTHNARRRIHMKPGYPDRSRLSPGCSSHPDPGSAIAPPSRRNHRPNRPIHEVSSRRQRNLMNRPGSVSTGAAPNTNPRSTWRRDHPRACPSVHPIDRPASRGTKTQPSGRRSRRRATR